MKKANLFLCLIASYQSDDLVSIIEKYFLQETQKQYGARTKTINETIIFH